MGYPLLTLKRAIDAYKSATSYQDRGYVNTAFRYGTPQKYSSTGRFRTVFRRPALVRFEYTYKHFEDSKTEQQFIFWSDGDSTFVRHSEESPVELKEFSFPNQIFSNVSSMGPPPVLSLLLGLVEARNYSEVCEYESEVLNGESCTVVGTDTIGKLSPNKNRLWISNSSSMIRKCRTESVLDLARIDVWNRQPVQNTSDSSDFEDCVDEYKQRTLATAKKFFEGRNCTPDLSFLDPNCVVEETFYSVVSVDEDIPSGAFEL